MNSHRGPTPGRLGVDVGSWEDVIDRVLSLRPDDRFADPGEFLAALEAREARTPVAAPVVATHAPTDRPRGPRTAGVVAVAIGLLAGLGLVASVALKSRASTSGSMATSLRATPPRPAPTRATAP